MFKRLKLLVSVLSLLTLTACFAGPPPSLYLLNSGVPLSENTSKQLFSSVGPLGISIVDLPGYANDTKIASLTEQGTVLLLDNHRWAEDPDIALTQLLSDRLRLHTQSTVLVEPWPRDYSPVARIEVSVSHFLREHQGGATLAGQIHVLSGDGRRLVESKPFEVNHRAENTHPQSYFAAVAQAVDDIAVLAIQQLVE